MKRHWTNTELRDCWRLFPAERRLVKQHRGRHEQLGFAVLLKFFQNEGRFPRHRNEIPTEAIAYVAQQLEVPAKHYHTYDWSGRSIKRHRAKIRAFAKFREATAQDILELTTWLCAQIVPHQRQMEALIDIVYGHCRALRIEPPTEDRLQRLIRSVLAAHDDRFCRDVLGKLTPETRKHLDDLVATTAGSEAESALGRSALQELKLDPGRLSLETIRDEIAKLERLRACGLPDDLFKSVSPQILETYRQRAVAEESYEIRRHPEALRYTLLAAFCRTRQQEIVDTLAELLIDTVHHIKTRAENRVTKVFMADIRRVSR